MLKRIKNSILKFPDQNAFYINGTFYTYREFGNRIKAIQPKIPELHLASDNIGIIANNDIDTYAGIISILFSGYGFVPINPLHPVERNLQIIEQAGIKEIVSSNKDILNDGFNSEKIRIICTQHLKSQETKKNDLRICSRDKDSMAYTIFTSGSTGIPKGVAISYSNINAFLDAFFDKFPSLDESDSFLQMYELTFDASIMHYLPALCVGACSYTIPDGEIKYLYAYKLLRDFKITFSLLTPSVLSYLKPYFDRIQLPSLRYSLFGAEAVPHELLLAWSRCVPDAQIYNAYGPTEASIFFLLYNWSIDNARSKTYNGLVPVGKPMKNSVTILINESGEIVENGIGELCVAGPQLTQGYVNNEEKNTLCFFRSTVNGHEYRFYRTGDLMFKDENGDYMFCGRIDEQVQIDGYRVELSEIEHYSRPFSATSNAVAIAVQNDLKKYQLVLFVEKANLDIVSIKKELKKSLPMYMIPEKIILLGEFPKNENAKVHKNLLRNLI